MGDLGKDMPVLFLGEEVEEREIELGHFGQDGLNFLRFREKQKHRARSWKNIRSHGTSLGCPD